MTAVSHEMVRTEWGLMHANGYVRWVDSFEDALDMKAGAKIVGRPGDWANHTIVKRTVTTTWTVPEDAL